jgi:hypothetical protein
MARIAVNITLYIIMRVTNSNYVYWYAHTHALMHMHVCM